MSSEKPLAGKVALITGASRGIGWAIARRLGSMGARVSLCARDAKTLESAATTLRRENIEVAALPADVRVPEEITALVAETRQATFQRHLTSYHRGSSRPRGAAAGVALAELRKGARKRNA